MPQGYALPPVRRKSNIWVWTQNSPWITNGSCLSAHIVCSTFSPLTSAFAPSSSFPHCQGSSEPFSSWTCSLLTHVSVFMLTYPTLTALHIALPGFYFFLPRKCLESLLESVRYYSELVPNDNFCSNRDANLTLLWQIWIPLLPTINIFCSCTTL